MERSSASTMRLSVAGPWAGTIRSAASRLSRRSVLTHSGAAAPAEVGQRPLHHVAAEQETALGQEHHQRVLAVAGRVEEVHIAAGVLVRQPVAEDHARQGDAPGRRPARRLVPVPQLRLDQPRAGPLRDDVGPGERAVAEHVVPVMVGVDDDDAPAPCLTRYEVRHGCDLRRTAQRVHHQGEAGDEHHDRRRRESLDVDHVRPDTRRQSLQHPCSLVACPAAVPWAPARAPGRAAVSARS